MTLFDPFTQRHIDVPREHFDAVLLELYPWKPWYAWYPVKLCGGKWAWRRVIAYRYVPFKSYYAEPFEVALGIWNNADHLY